jgi:hypothetical protein
MMLSALFQARTTTRRPPERKRIQLAVTLNQEKFTIVWGDTFSPWASYLNVWHRNSIHIPISAQEEANSVPGLFMRRFVRPNILKQAKVLKPNTYSSLRDVVCRGKVASKHEIVLLVDPLVIDI